MTTSAERSAAGHGSRMSCCRNRTDGDVTAAFALSSIRSEKSSASTSRARPASQMVFFPVPHPNSTTSAPSRRNGARRTAVASRSRVALRSES
jgi:hypothetical protein